MICLSGDLHHMSLGTGNQKYCDRTEIQVAQYYLDMLTEAKVKVTFFVSGKSFLEEAADLRPIVQNPLVEIGGHNFDCFEPMWWHRIWKKVNGSFNGPAWYQRRDALKTISAIERETGITIRSWRNHMYMHGPFTDAILPRCGIEICSDGVRRDSRGPRLLDTGLLDFPLNVMPDHEHIFHAERTPEWVQWFVRRYNWSDDYGSDSYHVEEWTDRVLDELRNHQRDGILSNMLIHPITLYLADKFKSFHRILDHLASRPSFHMSEVAAMARGEKSLVADMPSSAELELATRSNSDEAA